MEAVEQGDVEASYLLGFLDDFEGLDQGTLMGYDDLEYITHLEKQKEDALDHDHCLELHDTQADVLERSSLLGYELKKRGSFQIENHSSIICKK